MKKSTPISIKCFRCKEYKIQAITLDDVVTTKNHRRVASITCEDCGRKMTSLIKRGVFLEIGGKLEESKEEEQEPDSE